MALLEITTGQQTAGGKGIKNAILALLLAAACVAFFALGQSLRYGAEINVVAPSSIVMSYNDFIVLLLTCIALLLTILGFGIAVLTIFGVRNVRNIAAKQAFAAAKAALDDKDSPISRRILKVAEGSAYEGIESVNLARGRDSGEYD